MSVDEAVLLKYVLSNLSPEEERLVTVHLREHPENAG